MRGPNAASDPIVQEYDIHQMRSPTGGEDGSDSVMDFFPLIAFLLRFPLDCLFVSFPPALRDYCS